MPEDVNVQTIPFIDLHAQHQELRAELHAALDALLDDSAYILGPHVEHFENGLARYLGQGSVIGCSSGTEALNLAAHMLDLGPGDEVITVANTWISTVFAITRKGARPIFVDVNADTGQMLADSALAAITPRTKAIFAVHMFGHPAPVDILLPECRRCGIALIEDMAQSLGSRLHGRQTGTFGDFACLSFYPGKNLGALGDGGAIVAADPQDAARLRRLVNYGQADRHHHLEAGFNSRLDALQAAFLEIKLQRLDAWNAARRQAAQKYRAALADLPVQPLIEAEGCESNHHLFVIRTDRRDDCLERLRKNGVMAQVHYPTPVHLQPCYRDLGFAAGSLPVTETLAKTTLSLPIYPHISDSQIAQVVGILREFYKGS